MGLGSAAHPAATSALRSIRGTSKRPGDASEIQFVGQIAPVRIELLDQGDLPCAAPAQGMFSRARSQAGIEGFKIDELIDFILPCETGNELVFRFRQTPS